jgi:hypothetical protein
MIDGCTSSTSIAVIEQVPIGDSYDLRKRKTEDGLRKYAEDIWRDHPSQVEKT